MITTPTVVSIQPVSGYMMWQDGQPYGIPNGWSETKRSLLIGYDLMPLRGLEVTEQVMAEKGKIARETLVELSIMTDEDAYACNEFFWRSSNWHIYHDRRRLSTLERSRQKAIAVFERYRIEIVPIRYRLVEEVEV